MGTFGTTVTMMNGVGGGPGVPGGMGVDVAVGEGVGVAVDVAVDEGVGVGDGSGVGLSRGVGVIVGVFEGVGVMVGVLVGVGVSVARVQMAIGTDRASTSARMSSAECLELRPKGASRASPSRSSVSFTIVPSTYTYRSMNPEASMSVSSASSSTCLPSTSATLR